MARTLQAADCRGVSGIRIGIGARNGATGKRRVIAAAVLSMQHEHNVERFRLRVGELSIGTKHRQNGLGGRLAWNVVVNEHGVAEEFIAHHMIGKHHDSRKARKQHDGRVDFMLRATVFCFIIEGVQLQHRATHSVHQIARGRLHDVIRREAIGQVALGGNKVVEGFQLLGRRKLARHKQVRRFLEAETVFSNSMVDQIGNTVAAIRQASAVGNFIALRNNVAMHVRDIRNANHNARAVGIAQASLDIVSGVITRID